MSSKNLLGIWWVSLGYKDYDSNGESLGYWPSYRNPLDKLGIEYIKFTDRSATMDDGSQGYVLEAETTDGNIQYYTWQLDGNKIKGSLISGEIEWKSLAETIRFIKVKFTTPNMPSEAAYCAYDISYVWIGKNDFVGTWKGTNDSWEFYYYFNEDGTGWGEGYSRAGSEMRWEFTYTFTEGNEEGVAKCVGASGYAGFDGEVNLNNKFEATFVLGNHGKTLTGGDFSNVEFKRVN
ncbi:MAG: hypothetical protein IJ549_04765 [Prevotella sp.]|nr:hypothetical protein [Prevotella sp.]